jgi:hypothetical protein
MVGYTALSDDYIKKIAIITQSTAKLLIFVLLIVSLAKKGEREREFAPKDRISGLSM